MSGLGLEARTIPTDAGGSSSVTKALALLVAIAEQSETVRLSDLAAAVSLPKSTTHRLLKTLEESGFVGRSGSRYQIGNRFFELGEAARWSAYGALRDAAFGPLSSLFDQGGSAVHLAVLEGNEVLYLERFIGKGGARLPTRVGGRMPATCTALGKAMLAHSDRVTLQAVLSAPLPRITAYSIVDPRRLLEEFQEVRSSGIATEHEEGRLGVSCVAAPVLVFGSVAAAVSISVAGGGEPSNEQRRLVRCTAERIGRCLGHGDDGKVVQFDRRG